MSVTALIPRQQALLAELVRCWQHDLMFDVIRPIPTGPDTYVVYLRGKHNLMLRHIGDLDVLCTAGYLDFEFSRFGNQKVFMLSEKALAQPANHADLQHTMRQLKQQLTLLLTGDALTAALGEIEFVRGECASPHPDSDAISCSLERVTGLVSQRLRHEGQGVQVAAALTAIAHWIEQISHTIAL